MMRHQLYDYANQLICLKVYARLGVLSDIASNGRKILLREITKKTLLGLFTGIPLALLFLEWYDIEMSQ